MILQDLFSPEMIAVGIAALGFGMAVNDSREEKNRQREEARAEMEAERERKRLEHAMKVADARAAREEEAAQRKAEMEANRLAHSAQREQLRSARAEAQAMRKAELEAHAEEQKAIRESEQHEHRDKHAAAADHKSSFVDHSKPEISFVDESLMTDPEEAYFESRDIYIPETEPFLGIPVSDQGILSDFHGDHVGKGVFSEYRIDPSWPDESQVLSTYNLESALKVRLFFASSLYNLRLDLHDLPAFHPELTANVRVDFILDGQVISSFYDPIGFKEQLQTWTTWWYSIVAEEDTPWNTSAVEYEAHFGEMLENLSPGSHEFRMEWWMEADNNDGGEHLLVEADLHLDFDASQKAGWMARHGRVHVAQATASTQEQSFSYIRLTIQNSCDTDIKFELVQGAQSGVRTLDRRTTTTLNLSAGDKILMNGVLVHMAGPGSDGQHLQLCK